MAALTEVLCFAGFTEREGSTDKSLYLAFVDKPCERAQQFACDLGREVCCAHAKLACFRRIGLPGDTDQRATSFKRGPRSRQCCAANGVKYQVYVVNLVFNVRFCVV